MNIFGRNWRTTLIGFVGAAVCGATAYIQTGGVDLKDLFLCAIIAGLGYFAKDTAVSGTGR